MMTDAQREQLKELKALESREKAATQRKIRSAMEKYAQQRWGYKLDEIDKIVESHRVTSVAGTSWMDGVNGVEGQSPRT